MIVSPYSGDKGQDQDYNVHYQEETRDKKKNIYFCGSLGHTGVQKADLNTEDPYSNLDSYEHQFPL